MDAQLQKALEIADYMSTFSAQKQIIKEEYKQNLIYFYNGGTFTVTKELITFVKTIKDLQNTKEVVLVDDNDLPIDIKNIEDFLESILSKYFFAVNEYYTKYTNLKASRTVEGLIKK